MLLKLSLIKRERPVRSFSLGTVDGGVVRNFYQITCLLSSIAVTTFALPMSIRHDKP